MDAHTKCTFCGVVFGDDFPMGIDHTSKHTLCESCAVAGPEEMLREENANLREVLHGLLNNQSAGHRFARASEGDCLCRWCKAHRVLGYDAWPDAPPVQGKPITLDAQDKEAGRG